MVPNELGLARRFIAGARYRGDMQGPTQLVECSDRTTFGAIPDY